MINQNTGTIQGYELSSLLFDIGYSIPLERSLNYYRSIEAIADHGDTFFYGRPEELEKFMGSLLKT